MSKWGKDIVITIDACDEDCDACRFVSRKEYGIMCDLFWRQLELGPVKNIVHETYYVESRVPLRCDKCKEAEVKNDSAS